MLWMMIKISSLFKSGAQMALMPTRAHNSMIGSLLGPSFFGSDVWVGIYNWAYYDYYFRLVK